MYPLRLLTESYKTTKVFFGSLRYNMEIKEISLVRPYFIQIEFLLYYKMLMLKISFCTVFIPDSVMVIYLLQNSVLFLGYEVV